MKKINFTILFGAMVMSILFLGACQSESTAGNQSAASAKTTSASADASTSAANLPKYKFDSKGALMRPTDYRRWVYVGTPLTPNDLNPPEAAFPEFHNVYIHPADFDYWEKNGKWQDGTILVKELVGVRTKQHVSGKGYFQGEFSGLEATIKDSKVFADEPGNWGYFSFGHSYPLAETATAFPTAACNGCHATSAADDFVFTQDYPVLRAAKNSKNSATGFYDREDLMENVGEALTSTDRKEVVKFITEN